MIADREELYMVRLRLETRSIFELARRRRLPMHKVDTGYAVHCYLKELVGTHAPSPFAVVPLAGSAGTGRFLTVLGYGSANKVVLQNHAKALSDPAVYQGCDWLNTAVKPLPGEWPVGARFGFEVRACPTVRKRSDGPFHRRGAEVDVFISRCWDVGDPAIPVSREEVYCEWFSDQINRIGGAKLGGVKVRAFERERLLRRNHISDRKSHTIEKPGALFSGILEVTDTTQFSYLMQRGIGRHRAFGFGMILLRNEG